MKWLHFSDIHYNPKSDGRSSREIRDGLPVYIKDKGIQVDQIFFTGDYRHALLQKDEIILEVAKESARYILDIAEAAGVNDTEQIHIVPGNHDLTRDKNKGRIELIKKEYDSGNGSFGRDDLFYLTEQFDFFRCLCTELYGKDNFWSRYPLHNYRYVNDYVILCLNTAITHYSDKDRGSLLIGNDYMAHVLEDINKKHRNTPIIILAHHGLDNLMKHEKEVVEHLCRRYPVKFYLCGDAHEVWWRQINNHLEITMGCILQAKGVQAVFGYYDSDINLYCAYQWDSRFACWGTYEQFNQSLSRHIINKPKIPANEVTKTSPMTPSSRFCGRDIIAKDIIKAINGESNLLLVNGIGGIGKTEICRHLYKVCISTGITGIKSVGWLFYNENLSQTLYGQFPDVPIEEVETYSKNVASFLNRQGSDLLLFIDNVDNLTEKDILYLRKLRCKVVLISRCEIDQIQSIYIESLEIEDCRKIYIGITGGQASELQFIDEIIMLADRHTLAVELLAKTQHAAGLSAKELLNALNEVGFNLFSITEEIETSYNLDMESSQKENVRYKTFIEHLARVFDLQKVKENELYILKSFSLIPAQSVHLRDIRKWFNLDNLSGVNRLTEKGWLNRDSGSTNVVMHPLIAAVIQHKTQIDFEEVKPVVENIAAELFMNYNDKFTDKVSILSIAISVAEGIKAENVSCARLFNNIALIYSKAWDYSQSLLWNQRALEIREKILGKDHPETATTYFNIANAYHRHGCYTEALRWYRAALEVQEKSLGTESVYTAITYNNLQGIYVALGEYETALTLCFKALYVLEKTVGEDHLETAFCYNNIGQVYDKKADYREALKWYEKALTVREKLLGVEDPDTASLYINIAGNHYFQGNYDEALRWNYKALKVKEMVLGKEHPDIATLYNNISGIYYRIANYKEAKQLFLKATDIRERVFGFEHPDTAVSYNNMAVIHEKLGDLNEAIQYYEKSLIIYKKLLGTNSPEAATLYHNTAGIYLIQGNYPESLKRYQKALNIRENVLGINHPETALTCNNMGWLYLNQEAYPEALHWYEKALTIREKMLGTSHIDTASTYNDIGWLHDRQGNNPEALKWYRKALDIFEVQLGLDHPFTVTVTDNINVIESKTEGV